tara:strand:+ start:2809 stop:3126 length:318 start_codon:yes stop_codon:yes gene_type:complete
MLFCPKCGSIMSPKEEGKKTYLICSCGHNSIEKDDILMKEDVKAVKKVEILDKASKEAMPKTKEKCPKCSFHTAYFWTQQTRASDEAETRFFECSKCNHRWRSYD